MKKGLPVIFILLLSAVVHGQQEIKLEDLNKHVGDSVTVCTKIYGGIFLDRSKDTPTLLNAGDKYPNAPLTVVSEPMPGRNSKRNPNYFIKTRKCVLPGKSVCIRINRR